MPYVIHTGSGEKIRTREFQATNPTKKRNCCTVETQGLTSPTFLSHHHPEKLFTKFAVGSWEVFPEKPMDCFSRCVSCGVGFLMCFPQTENKGCGRFSGYPGNPAEAGCTTKKLWQLCLGLMHSQLISTDSGIQILGLHSTHHTGNHDMAAPECPAIS